jgi:hypothetical protein
MSSNLVNDPERWRLRAEKARDLAARARYSLRNQMKTPGMKETSLK